MDLFKTLNVIVLSILGRNEFAKNDSGHLVLTDDEIEKLNSQMKFADGKFAERFTESFNALADAAGGNEINNNEMVVSAFVETIRKDVADEIIAKRVEIEAGLKLEFESKIAGLESSISASEQKFQATEMKRNELEAENLRLVGENRELKMGTEGDVPERIIINNIKAMGEKKFNVNMELFHNKMADQFLKGNTALAIMAMTNASFGNKSMGGGATDTIDVSEINEEFGSYMADPATRMKIFKDLLRPTESRKYMTKVLALTEWRDAKAVIDSVVQQFIAKWTPLGKTTVTPLRILNRRHKINLPIVPNDITGGYMTYLYNEGLTPDQMPVIQYIIENLLRPRIADDIEYKMIATGVFDELVDSSVTEGDAGQATGKNMDGFLTIIASEAENVSTKVNFWTPSVEWSEDNSVEYFEAYAKWVKATNPTLAAIGLNVFCDPNMAELRAKKYREMFPNTKNADATNTQIDFSKLTIVPLENMRGSGVIFSTPKENFIELHHINEAAGSTRLFLQLMNYEVRIFGEFWLGVGFAVAEWLFAAVGAAETSGSGS